MADELEGRLKDITDRRASLRKAAKPSVITDLEALDLKSAGEVSRVAQGANREYLTKLQQAREFSDKMKGDLADLSGGIVERLREIGFSIQEAGTYQTGSERFYAFFGSLGIKSAQDTADRLRLQRLRTQTTDQSVKQISWFVVATVEGLNAIEREFEAARSDYKQSIGLALNKYEEAQPLYEQARTKREELEVQLKKLKLDLESGQVSVSDRPAKERELHELQGEYDKIHLYEQDMMIVIKVAQEANLELQKNLDSAQRSIESIHGMRRQLLEEHENYKSILKHAMKSVKAHAEIERMNVVAPAHRAAISVITENNTKLARGAMETFTDHLAKAAISPEESSRIAREYAEATSSYLERLAELAKDVERGVRQPQDANPSQELRDL